jgi:ABC-type lipoprotein export system ATPase subunit
MDPPTGAQLKVEGVSKRFGERITALRDVSFELGPGELVLLAGPSGAGKSTLLNLIAGFDRPDSGRILVDGQCVASIPDPARYRRQEIGFVFQLHHLIGGLTAEETVEVPLIPGGGRRAARMQRARAVLAEVGLGDRGGHRPGQLSGGERQRVALARALVCGPRLLLADEPTGALDSEAGREVMALLTRLARRKGVTVLLVSHDPEARRSADRVLQLRDGHLTAAQPSASLTRSRVTHQAG